MAALNRIRTAFSRYRRSKGFGIHSPFAFHFVLRVLREKSPYYAYKRIDEMRELSRSCRNESPRAKRPRVISKKSARMVFRLVNHFNPLKILMLGADYGVSAYCALSVSSKSRMWICGREFPNGCAKRILAEKAGRIEIAPSASTAIAGYEAGLDEGERRFAIVNAIPSDDFPEAGKWIAQAALTDGSVVVVRNLNHDDRLAGIWKNCTETMRSGMSFTNGKFGIIVADAKLPPQHFQLWF